MATRVATAVSLLASPFTFAVGFVAGVAVADRWNRTLRP
jgi:hypothetical protein